MNGFTHTESREDPRLKITAENERTCWKIRGKTPSFPRDGREQRGAERHGSMHGCRPCFEGKKATQPAPCPSPSHRLCACSSLRPSDAMQSLHSFPQNRSNITPAKASPIPASSHRLCGAETQNHSITAGLAFPAPRARGMRRRTGIFPGGWGFAGAGAAALARGGFSAAPGGVIYGGKVRRSPAVSHPARSGGDTRWASPTGGKRERGAHRCHLSGEGNPAGGTLLVPSAGGTGRKPPRRGEAFCFSTSKNSRGCTRVMRASRRLHTPPTFLVTGEAISKGGHSPVPAAIAAGWGKSDGCGVLRTSLTRFLACPSAPPHFPSEPPATAWGSGAHCSGGGFLCE